MSCTGKYPWFSAGMFFLVGLSILGFPAGFSLSQEVKELRILASGKKQLFVKVIVKQPTTLHKNIGDKGEAVGEFLILHKLYTDDGMKDKDGWVRVGTATGKHVGWIKQNDVYDWPTRFILTPILHATPPNFTVYDDEQLKKEYVVLASTPKGKAALVAILNTKGKEEDPIYHVAFFMGQADTTTGKVNTLAGENTPGAKAQELEGLKLEIVLVIDTTGSMSPLIDGAKLVMGQVAEKLGKMPQLKGAVRFGLVEYRDVEDAFTSRLVSPLTDDLNSFKQKLDSLTAGGGGDLPEQVLDGMKTAIEKSNWGTVSTKHIIVLGDASAHQKEKSVTKMTIKQMIDLGRPSAGAESQRQLMSINFHAVRALLKPPLHPEAVKDSEECRQHFQEISRNNKDLGHSSGLYCEFDPNSLKDQERVINELTQMLMSTAAGVSAVREGRLEELPKLIQAERHPELLEATFRLVKAHTGDTPKPTGDGWTADRAEDGKELAHLRIMVERKELKRLESTLDFLHVQFKTREDPAERKDVGGLVTVLQQAASSTVSGQIVTPETKLQELITDLPLVTKALEITAQAVARMNESAYDQWLKELETARDRARVLAERKEWVNVSGGLIPNEQYLFLRHGDMP